MTDRLQGSDEESAPRNRDSLRRLLSGLLAQGLTREKLSELVFWSVWIGLLPVPFTHTVGIVAIVLQWTKTALDYVV